MPHTATSTADTSGRFQCAAGACLLVAASILERTGIAPIQTKLVLDAVIAALRIGKKDRKSAQEQVGHADILREFFKAKEGSRLMLRRTQQGLTMRSDHPFVTRPVAYEVLITDKEVVIDWRELHRFLLDRGHNSSEVFREIEKIYPHTLRPMGVGTAYATTVRKVIPIPLPGTPWAGLADS